VRIGSFRDGLQDHQFSVLTSGGVFHQPANLNGCATLVSQSAVRHYGETDLGLQSCADYSAGWCRRSTPAGRVSTAAGSPRPAMRICAAFSSKRRGTIATGQPSAPISGSASGTRHRPRSAARGGRSIGCTHGTDGSSPAGSRRNWRPPPSLVNYRRSCGVR